ncbi:MAG: hypothetical protein IJ153_05465 [Clostridia bacterium]|nr:hypothetical protein [Clostridia bacterium]
MPMDTFSGDKAMIRAAQRSIEDMKAERAAMVKRRAPAAVIMALDKRIEKCEQIIKEGEKNQ